MITVKHANQTYTFTERDLQRDEPRSFWGEPKCRAWHKAKLQKHVKAKLNVQNEKVLENA